MLESLLIELRSTAMTKLDYPWNLVLQDLRFMDSRHPLLNDFGPFLHSAYLLAFALPVLFSESLGYVPLLMLILFAAIYGVLIVPVRRRVKEELAGLNILERLALSDESLSAIWERTPWPWRAIFMGPRPRGLRDTARLVGYNLDWYLRPPRTHFRSSWLAQIAVVLAFIAILAPNSLTRAAVFGALESVSMLYFMILVLMLLGSSVRRRQQIYFAHFINMLQERIEEDKVQNTMAGRVETEGTARREPLL